jgi:ATPase
LDFTYASTKELINMKKRKQIKSETDYRSLKNIVPDTSVLVHGRLSSLIEEGKIRDARIIIPQTVLDELQAQASRGREIGFEGLEEIKRVREIGKKQGIKLEFTGKRPTLEEIQLAKKGRLDAIIKDAAVKENATLMTCDYVQALVGEVENVPVVHVPQPLQSKLSIEKYFTADTQSVHMKTGVKTYAKRGKPGNVKVVTISKKESTEEEISGMINQIMSKTRRDAGSFIEIGKQGAMVIQSGLYRIAITRPPFADGLEMTIVRPIAKVRLEDYKLHDELQKRLASGSEGVLISGPPGSGKSTFAASVAEFLVAKGKIVKTFEQPRDLQVGPEVTQYAPLEGDWEKTAELLLLVRPDYTIFDEVRKTRDFRVFADMRLAGVGMIGVVHATDTVSSIQRFVGRIELGMIPHVINTVIYINAGKVEKVYEVALTVKMPSGMQEEDLTRPVVEIRDFETKKLEYEIYTYGEENVIVPVAEKLGAEGGSPARKLAAESIKKVISHYDPAAEVELTSDTRASVRVKPDVIPRLIGAKGKNINELEKRLGIKLSVEPKGGTFKKDLFWDFEEHGGSIYLTVAAEYTGKQVEIYAGNDLVLSAHVGKKGKLKIRKKSDVGRNVLSAITKKELRIVA